MNHFVKIYSSMAMRYHEMIEAEDAENNLLSAILSICTLEKIKMLDVGTGTGRIPILAAPFTSDIHGLDLHQNMLLENKKQRKNNQGEWTLTRGDLRRIPYPENIFDVVTAGWAIGHFCGWYPGDWRAQVKNGLLEMLRVTKPHGNIIILETMSTGSGNPSPPTPQLAAYYQILENEWDFDHFVIQTDYLYATAQEAIKKTEFFFGPELSMAIRNNDWRRIPEWTGIWHRSK